MSTKFDEEKSKDEIEREIAKIMSEYKTEVPLTDKEIEKKLQQVYSA